MGKCRRPAASDDIDVAGKYSKPSVAEGVPLELPYRTCARPSELQSELQDLKAEVARLREALASVPTAGAGPLLGLDSPNGHKPDIKFERVQYIPLLVNTGPHQGAGKGENDRYVGIPNFRKDFAARVRVVRVALEEAERYADKDPKCLKIFALPEFFFRGPQGAYSLQDTLGDAYHTNSFIFQLQSLLADSRWESWIGVFGTLIACYIAPGKKMLHNVYNMCLVQQGGFGGNATERGKKCQFVLKHWMSSIDFLDGGGPADEGMVGFDDEHWLENHQQHYLDGLRAYGRLQDSCLLRYGGVSIGLEICLDHAESRLKSNEAARKYQHNRPVEIQIVISSGMSLADEAMVVNRPGGLAFINDGMGTNEGVVDGRTDCRLYKEQDSYERIEPDLKPAFPDISPEEEETLANLFCMDADSVPTKPLLAVYPVLKVTDYDD
eukprot:CAMPEP_0177764860 /NCGR_PEP_ID=MMETSP0491_2-20121128/7651_1 /TAXON_ID=63592 /ORGANISM="Tetraselmis chuii, Strain PLY429" /LENGTH=437 /DNA_ID=CAMNT_0019281105 /DNA_START=244 /DNA_END=1557 /DNA_ORIENTATION=+